ncbi:hypothetical protein [Pseudomonas sp. S1(2024)]|uniref:hypothetical protein n=1 Tax=Pseudomonas sp. S1(2024) TaxID=3390191 RepID=UPI003978F3C3
MSENSVSDMSDLSEGDAKSLVGQTIASVQATEYGLTLTFASGAVLTVEGQTYGDCALSVNFAASPEDKGI